MTGPLCDMLIPLQTPSQNKRERWHWSKQRKEVTHWTFFLTNQRARHNLPPAETKRHVAIKAFRTQRCHDQANLEGGCKGLIDGLVRSGWLVDDSIAWATFTYAQDVASKSPTKKPCTRIVITEAREP